MNANTFARVKHALFWLIALTGLLLAAAALDRVTGWALIRMNLANLIFPPHSVYRYRTPEFACTAHINSLGFRDRKFALRKEEGHTRILVLGDSFTFGWGVADAQAWPKILEANLQSRGYAVEIANLGQPAASPHHYARLAGRAIPLLEPDLVVVALLQGDDLAQLHLAAKLAGPKPGVAWRLLLRAKSLAQSLYPNSIMLLQWAKAAALAPAPSVEIWQEQVRQILSAMTAEQKSRWARVDERLQRSFTSGELNPSLLKIATAWPEYYAFTLDLAQPTAQQMIAVMGHYLARMRRLAQASGAAVLVLSVPHSPYVSQASRESLRQMGFVFASQNISFHEADEAIALACRRAGLEYVTVTDDFAATGADSMLYFVHDGHFTADGHRVFANQLAPYLQNKLGRRTVSSP